MKHRVEEKEECAEEIMVVVKGKEVAHRRRGAIKEGQEWRVQRRGERKGISLETCERKRNGSSGEFSELSIMRFES